MILFAWVDNDDLAACEADYPMSPGPIRRAIDGSTKIRRVCLLSARKPSDSERYRDWLIRECPTVTVEAENFPDLSPVDYAGIYARARETVESVLTEVGRESEWLFHMSCGSPAMRTAWVLLLPRFQGKLIQTAPSTGLEYIDFPFDISATLLRDASDARTSRLVRRDVFSEAVNSAFSEVVHGSEAMKAVVGRAKRFAAKPLPVLITGESGTGKELFAAAMHHASPRANKPFKAVNCGAIPENLIETELFGHEAGAFTGASRRRAGWFESANEGTLFLDEIGELPMPMQVRLLRVLQTGEVTRVGSTDPMKVDVRIVSATNRCLVQEVSAGRFREDLYYRLSVGVIQLPALRDRGQDLSQLISREIEILREKYGFSGLILSAAAMKRLLDHDWPGNVRELQNTLGRIAVEVEDGEVSASDVETALMHSASRSSEKKQSLSDIQFPVDLDAIARESQRPFIEAALATHKNNKTQAARALGLGSQQVLTKRMATLGIF
jgi:DNA-binding NtrC family response regulator